MQIDSTSFGGIELMLIDVVLLDEILQIDLQMWDHFKILSHLSYKLTLFMVNIFGRTSKDHKH